MMLTRTEIAAFGLGEGHGKLLAHATETLDEIERLTEQLAAERETRRMDVSALDTQLNALQEQLEGTHAGCAGCKWRIDPDGGYCYMFRIAPKMLPCAQFKEQARRGGRAQQRRLSSDG
jgi:hypothetical protein